MKNRPNPILLALFILGLLALAFYPLYGWQREAERSEALEQQVTELTTQNRGPQGPDGDPGRAPTADEIAAAVEAYCAAHNSCTGPQGIAGKDGADGAPGNSPTLDIQCLGNHWKVVVNGAVTRDLNVYCF